MNGISAVLKILFKLVFLVVMLFNLDRIGAQADNDGICSARLQTEISKGFVEVSAVCKSARDIDNLRYEFEMIKKGQGGNSSNTQKGRFNIKAGENRNLSRQKINFSDNDDIKFMLKIFRNDELIAEDYLNQDDLKSRGAMK